MASPTVTVTVLFFTLAFSVSSCLSVKPENDIIAENLVTLSAEPDPDTTVPSLPKSESEHESDEVAVPVNFHPINRHFPRRPLTTAPVNGHPCHHRQHELSERGPQIPFGNDMIFAGGEKATETDHWPQGIVSDFPAIRISVGPFASDQSKEKTKHYTGHYVVRREEDGHEAGEAEDSSRDIMVTRVKLIKRKGGGENEKEYYNGMFGRKIRKFLNHLV